MMINVRDEEVELGSSSFTAMTFNMWGDSHLDRRVDVIRQLFLLRPPDILGVQELTSKTRDVLDGALSGYRRVTDESSAWRSGQNIWWRTALFEYIEHGFEPIEMPKEHGGLYWVRLKPLLADSPAELVFSTSHLTYQRDPNELADLKIRRVQEARIAIERLDEIAGSAPVIFTADVNDVAPVHLEFGKAGYLDTFTALGRDMPPTHPVSPAVTLGRRVWSKESPFAGVRKAFDVIFTRGELAARTSEVVDFYFDGQVPSDHAPVTATFTFHAQH
jgi:endonuclease/exonuclease/phosphatase family metal-dependent hydrolase